MLCCFQTPWSDPHSAYNNQAIDSSSNYPGRRFVPTGGNALAAAPGGDNSPPPGLIAVTVPPGVTGGEEIHVLSPDGSGQMIKAVVPHGMQPGSTFMVKAPEPQQQQQQQMQQSVAPVAQPVSGFSNATPVAEAVPFSQALQTNNNPSAVAAPVVTPIVNTLQPISAGPSDPNGQSLLKVKVPPGTAPGTTLHVQVPGENRTVVAQVPPNCTEFHVSYEPAKSMAPAPLSPVAVSPAPSLTAPLSPVASMSLPILDCPHSPPGQKLLLVRVPPGTPPGTTLHVQIPNEPGRMVSAQVPPGNVKEFHVSYQPSYPGQTFQSASSNQPMYQQNGMNGQQRPYKNNNNNNGYNNNNNGYNDQNYNNNRHNNNNDGGYGSSILPVVGGIAAGAAGLMAYEHFAHANGAGNDGGMGSEYGSTYDNNYTDDQGASYEDDDNDEEEDDGTDYADDDDDNDNDTGLYDDDDGGDDDF